MCLYTSSNEPIILKKPMKVYKVVYPTRKKDVFESVIRGFRYTIGTLYERKKKPTLVNGVAIRQAVETYYVLNGGVFHSFARKEDAFRDSAYDSATLGRKSVVVECNIPKGSRVYEGIVACNQIHEIASSAIIIKKVIEK